MVIQKILKILNLFLFSKTIINSNFINTILQIFLYMLSWLWSHIELNSTIYMYMLSCLCLYMYMLSWLCLYYNETDDYIILDTTPTVTIPLPPLQHESSTIGFSFSVKLGFLIGILLIQAVTIFYAGYLNGDKCASAMCLYPVLMCKQLSCLIPLTLLKDRMPFASVY